MADSQVAWPDELFADIERSGPVPLYFQLSSRLERGIQQGAFPAGSRLENEIAIAERLGISRPTVRRAIQELVDKGLLVRRRGIGTQVVQGQVTRPVELTSLYDDLKNSQHTPGTMVLTHEVIPATAAIAAGLGLAVGTDIFHLRRLRSTDGTPVAVLENHLPVELADLTTEQLGEKGLYQLLRSRGISIKVANQRIGARRALPAEAELLQVERGGPVLTAERTSFDQAGRTVEFSTHCYRPDMYSFATTLVAK